MTTVVCAQSAMARPLKVVCVEAVWCNIVSQLGGDTVEAHPLFHHEGSDPHFQQITPNLLRQLARSDLVVRNGGGYDNWADTTFNALRARSVAVLDVSSLVPDLARVNPHLFYSLDATEHFARAFSDRLIARFPEKEAQLAAHHQAFVGALTALRHEMSLARKKLAGATVAESEPVAAFLLRDLRVNSIDPAFALAIMHHAEPAPRDIAELESAFQTRRVAAFIVNPTVMSPAVNVMIDKARDARIPIIMSPEYSPPGVMWQDWIRGQIEALERISG